MLPGCMSYNCHSVFVPASGLAHPLIQNGIAALNELADYITHFKICGRNNRVATFCSALHRNRPICSYYKIVPFASRTTICSVSHTAYHAVLVLFPLISAASNLTILLGHIFCRPCLDSLLRTSQTCPNCRAPSDRSMIRKLVCTYQDPPTPNAPAPSEAERMVWQSISSTIEPANDHNQRRLLVRDNSKQFVQGAGFSEVCTLETGWIRSSNMPLCR